MAGSINVNVQITAPSEDEAAAVSKKLSADTINGLLARLGLPEAQVVRYAHEQIYVRQDTQIS